AGRVEVLGSGQPAPHQGHQQQVHDSQSYKSSLPAPEICRQPGNEASGETAQYGACYVDSRGFHRFFLTPLFANIGNSGGKDSGNEEAHQKTPADQRLNGAGRSEERRVGKEWTPRSSQIRT